MDGIIIKGARENNLQNVSIQLPKNKLTVFTGVSGSGKSSLVFDTIGAESQRQLNETYDSFIRHRLPHYGQPNVEKIENLNVSIIINQKRIGGNARSTVGTATDIYSLLRLLFSRVGQPLVGESGMFSFNNPKGMCPHCEGLGKVNSIDITRLLDKNKSLNEGAILFPSFQPGSHRWTRYVWSGYFANDKKIKDYTKEERELLLYATPHKPKHPQRQWGKTMQYEGIVPRIERTFLKRESKEYLRNKEGIEKIIVQTPCPVCKGARLSKKVLQCRINKLNIADCTALQIDELIAFLQTIKIDKMKNVVQETISKLQHLVNIGLSYLSLDRETASLSGGESQRIKMVKHLGSSLTGLIFIFDEPSTGLHPSDVHRLNKLMLQLRDKGNTILVVEHDQDVIAIADHIVDMGPEAGRMGGTVVYQGDLEGLKKSDGLTGQFFRQKHPLNLSPKKPTAYLPIKNARLHNLKNVSVAIPQGVLTVVTGVAGSGKSSLINKVLPTQYPEARLIDQGALTGSRRSHLASYSGIFDTIRTLFSKTNKVSASLFSANSEGGCPACKGLGTVSLDLAFMDAVEETCDVCGGTGYRNEALQYRLREKNIYEVLRMTVAEARTFFTETDIDTVLNKLVKTGLGYITLGQPLSSFSGGERQRLKLATELEDEGVLYIFDEPTTGLHPSDVQKLMAIFTGLVARGNTVIIIEHNLDVIGYADWVIDIGPGAGSNGGQVVFEGTLQQLLKSKNSVTAKCLLNYIGKQ